MSKIAIISQPEQGVLIDVGGCATLQEATQHLTCTLQVSSHFWEEQPVDLNLGALSLTRDELGQVLATLSEVGVKPRQVFARSAGTKAALRAFNIVPAAGEPTTEAAVQAATAGDEPCESTATSTAGNESGQSPPASKSGKKQASKPAAKAEAPATTSGDAAVSVTIAEAAIDSAPPTTDQADNDEAENDEEAPLTFEPGDD